MFSRSENSCGQVKVRNRHRVVEYHQTVSHLDEVSLPLLPLSRPHSSQANLQARRGQGQVLRRQGPQRVPHRQHQVTEVHPVDGVLLLGLLDGHAPAPGALVQHGEALVAADPPALLHGGRPGGHGGHELGHGLLLAGQAEHEVGGRHDGEDGQQHGGDTGQGLHLDKGVEQREVRAQDQVHCAKYYR